MLESKHWPGLFSASIFYLSVQLLSHFDTGKLSRKGKPWCMFGEPEELSVGAALGIDSFVTPAAIEAMERLDWRW